MALSTMSLDLKALAEAVHREAKAITDFCDANASPSPSFSQAWPDDLPQNIQASRMKLSEAAKAIHDISVGPHDHLFGLAWSVCSPIPASLFVD